MRGESVRVQLRDKTRLVERRPKVLPVPAIRAVVELGAAKSRPLVVVVPGATVQELTVDGGSSTNSHAEDDGGSAVVDAGNGRGGDDKAASTTAILGRVEVTDSPLNLAILYDKDGPWQSCVSILALIYSSKGIFTTHSWERQPKHGGLQSGRRCHHRR